MKSPITGKEMVLTEKSVEVDGVEFLQLFYVCLDSGEKFTTTELDEINLKRFEKKIN